MLRIHSRIALLVLPVTLTTLAFAQGQEAALIQNGNLGGWRYGKELVKEAETPDKRFYLGDGSLIMAAKDKDGKKDVQNLIATREFAKDFVLKLEFKAAQEATGAVTIRNTPFPVGDFIRRNEQKQMKNFKNDGWNELEITVKMAAHAEGRRLTDSDTLEAGFQNGKATARVNGRVVDPNRVVIQIEGHAKVNGETLANYPVALATKGQVGLRTGSGKIEFRNIRFRELP